jgi:hypothetical protein
VRHRHLIDGVGLTTAAIDDILDRGSLDDWLSLRDAAKRDKAIAERIVRICRAHEMYGTSPLWIAVVNRLNEERR